MPGLAVLGPIVLGTQVAALAAGATVTDEASAVERLGLTFTPFEEALRRSVAGILARG